MTAIEIVTTIGGSGLIVVILSLIKVKPLEISVWHWLARKVGKALNGETNDRLDAIEKALTSHLEEEERKDIMMSRTKILRFADEMYEQKYHSKEHFEEMFEQIKQYNEYCEKHPGFKNDCTVIAQSMIRKQYEECMLRGTFDVHKS